MFFFFWQPRHRSLKHIATKPWIKFEALNPRTRQTRQIPACWWHKSLEVLASIASWMKGPVAMYMYRVQGNQGKNKASSSRLPNQQEFVGEKRLNFFCARSPRRHAECIQFAGYLLQEVHSAESLRNNEEGTYSRVYKRTIIPTV